VSAVSRGWQRGDSCGGGQGKGGGWRGGGAADEETTAIVVTECGGCRPSLSTTIAAPTKAGEIPARTMMEEEVAVEAAVVARRIATPPPPPGGRLQFYRIALALAVECSTLYTAAPSASAAAAAAAVVAHILPMIGKTTMRAAGVGAPVPPPHEPRP